MNCIIICITNGAAWCHKVHKGYEIQGVFEVLEVYKVHNGIRGFLSVFKV